MSYGTPDVYYQPEEFGLTQVAQIDYSDGCYEFDYRVVWKHESGAFYTARDSGCSCPSPFEDYTSLKKLEPLDFDSLKQEVEKEIAHFNEGGWGNSAIANEGGHFLDQVRKALRDQRSGPMAKAEERESRP